MRPFLILKSNSDQSGLALHPSSRELSQDTLRQTNVVRGVEWSRHRRWLAVAIARKAIALDSDRRFAMSAWKPLAIALALLGMIGSVGHADPITWPGGLDNWVFFLAAQS